MFTKSKILAHKNIEAVNLKTSKERRNSIFKVDDGRKVFNDAVVFGRLQVARLDQVSLVFVQVVVDRLQDLDGGGGLVGMPLIWQNMSTKISIRTFCFGFGFVRKNTKSGSEVAEKGQKQSICEIFF